MIGGRGCRDSECVFHLVQSFHQIVFQCRGSRGTRRATSNSTAIKSAVSRSSSALMFRAEMPKVISVSEHCARTDPAGFGKTADRTWQIQHHFFFARRRCIDVATSRQRAWSCELSSRFRGPRRLDPLPVRPRVLVFRGFLAICSRTGHPGQSAFSCTLLGHRGFRASTFVRAFTAERCFDRGCPELGSCGLFGCRRCGWCLLRLSSRRLSSKHPVPAIWSNAPAALALPCLVARNDILRETDVWLLGLRGWRLWIWPAVASAEVLRPV
jgi:hypothetical protein